VRHPVLLDAENTAGRFPAQDFADASAAQVAGRSAVAGCPELYLALAHGCPCELASADEEVVLVAPDAAAHPLLAVHSL
jgi:hypothetical protein